MFCRRTYRRSTDRANPCIDHHVLIQSAVWRTDRRESPVGGGHDHGAAAISAAQAHRGRLLVALAIAGTVLVGEVVGALLTGSLALLADAGHVLTDAVGVGLALLAVWFAGRP